MRTSNRGSARPSAVRLLLAGLLAAGTASACSSPPPASIAPSPRPAPTATPDPHLSEPASVDDLYRKLGGAGLRITANTATAGRDAEPVKQVNATYRDWPLIITQFSSRAALIEATRFDPARPPRRGEPPYRLVGLNILVEYGPRVTNSELPPVPDSDRRVAAIALVEVLDLLLGPLQQSAVEPVPLPGSSPKPTSSPGT
jgi:hypothetical protein